MKKKAPPIGNAQFKIVREMGYYYIDKSLLIKDYIESGDTVTLITRPRRFGKTLNMTMLREFFDITADSRALFDGLAIMDTEYSGYINTRPVVFLSFKDCQANTPASLTYDINFIVKEEYKKYYEILRVEDADRYESFFSAYDKLKGDFPDINILKHSIAILEKTLAMYYKINPIVLIDEYDQPILSSYEYGYYNEMKTFFSGFYGAALKDQEFMSQAMLTGIQRVAKESIFSQLNNINVYTVLNEKYSGYFGFTAAEASDLLAYYNLTLDDSVIQKYNGYIFGGVEIYNPWSLLCYACAGIMDNYWINTSTNFLIKSSIDDADELFHESFQSLISEGVATVGADLHCSFIELKDDSTLWGLLINAGYVTVTGQVDSYILKVKIPNDEVASEFIKIVASQARIQDTDLRIMLQCLQRKDMDGFFAIYRKIVVACTSYFDAKENAYHMLFLGMCISLRGMYKITSNIEAGYGRSDIRLESSSPERPHIIIEFKQGDDVEALKNDALRQIIKNEYYADLRGEILCVGIAHKNKKCSLAYKTLHN